MSYIQTFDSEIIVRKAEHLSGTLDSTKVYVIDGEVDMGSQAITVPPDGLEIRGLGLNVSVLKSTANSYTMFVDSAGDAGGISLADMTLTCSGTSSKIFELDNAAATVPSAGRVELLGVNYTDVTEIGDLSNFVQMLQMTCVWRNVSDGYTFHGTWGGALFIDSFLVRGFGSSGVMFREGGTLTFGSRMFCNGNIEVPSGSIVYNFSTSVFNDASFELIFGNYSGTGTVSSVITSADTEARFRDNNGLNNTYVGGRWYIDTGDSLTTTIATQDVYVKVAGTTTNEDLQWFSAPGNNDLTFDSTQSVEVQITGSINVSAVSGGSDKNITLTLRQWDDSGSVYIDLPNTAQGVSTSAATFHNIGIIGYTTLETNDRIELWIENNSDTVDLAVDVGSLLSITERAN